MNTSLKLWWGFVFFIGIILIYSLPQASAQNKFNLKPGAEGKLCLMCHVTFQEKLKEAHVHTPVKSGMCSDCHNPHASDHGKLLDVEVDRICAKCHGGMIPDAARSAHKVVVEGNCTACHDPHASKNAANLLARGNELCLKCHVDIGKKVAEIKFSHNPVENDCLNCHNPHASEVSGSLLVDAVPSLCLNCHRADRPIFSRLHMNYPVQKARCTTCHDPHGSNKSVILYERIHVPVENKMCSQCHNEPSSPEPFGLKAGGYETCKSCHYDLVNDVMNKDRIHWPVLDSRGCINCHSPHASKEKALLQEPMLELCGSCHSDTIERQVNALAKHEPVNTGQCTACHAVHGSDYELLFRDQDVTNICGACHDWLTHSTHPIGAEYTDPRNPNLEVQCLSCHRSHGNENKHMFHFSEETELCVQCHERFKR